MVWFGGWVEQDSSELSNVMAEVNSVRAYQTAEEGAQAHCTLFMAFTPLQLGTKYSMSQAQI